MGRLLASLKALYAVAPGFKSDRSEEWELYLSTEDRVFVKDFREELLVLCEESDTIRSGMKQALAKLGDRNKTTVTSEYNAKLKQANTKIDQLVKRNIKKLEMLKQEGIKRKREELRELIKPTKRQRCEDAFVDASVDEIDQIYDSSMLCPNEYLPREDASDEDDDVIMEEEPVIVHQKSKAPEARYEEIILGEPSNAAQIVAEKQLSADELYLAGIEIESYKEILLELKILVQRYGCRDRVIDALSSYNKRDKIISFFDILSNTIGKRAPSN